MGEVWLLNLRKIQHKNYQQRYIDLEISKEKT
jgi:hypothetical protein